MSTTLLLLLQEAGQNAASRSSSPIVAWIQDSFEESPFLTVLAGLAVLAVLLWLLRSAIKIFIGVVLLAAIALLASFFLQGEEETNDLIREGMEKAGEKVEEMKDRGLIQFAQEPETGGAGAGGDGR